MIPLNLPAVSEATGPYVARLRVDPAAAIDEADAILVVEDEEGPSFSGLHGLLTLEGVYADALEGDVVLVQPDIGRAERLLRHGSPHNTLLVTERCDQLCVMCSQPPKKTHVDRFALFEQACLLAEPDIVIGITGGEPTLYKDDLFGLIERVGSARPDLEFHILTNAQHFEASDIDRLRQDVFRRVSWGIPLYSHEPARHDEIVGKAGAFDRLQRSFHVLLLAGARIELRTVLIQDNINDLPQLARLVTSRLRFIESWSIMQLEKTGFARNRWAGLFADHKLSFELVAAALDYALLHGKAVHLFNFPRCTVPAEYRALAPASISDWKRKFAPACATCREQDQCCGFFEWHPDEHANAWISPL